MHDRINHPQVNAADILAAHQRVGDSGWCASAGCDWRPTYGRGGLAEVQFAEHQADTLVAAGVLATPTEVEWGVRYTRDTTPRDFPMPDERSAREHASDPEMLGAVVIARDVHRSAWREVQP